MNYPRITLPHTLRDVAEKVIEEARELISAIDHNDDAAILEEACDVEHAAETLVRKLWEVYGLRTVHEARQRVIDKNEQRGYYAERLNYLPPELKPRERVFVLPKGEEG